MIATSIQNLKDKGLIKSPDDEEEENERNDPPQAEARPANQPDPPLESLEDTNVEDCWNLHNSSLEPSQQTVSSSPELETKAADPSPSSVKERVE